MQKKLMMLIIAPTYFYCIFGMEITITNHDSKKMMSNKWFKDEKSAYHEANDCLDKQQWKKAGQMYAEKILNQEGSPYDQAMGCVNFALTQMAQRRSSEWWRSVDNVVGIPEEKKLPFDLNSIKKDSVIVFTDEIGIGDIVHFIQCVKKLREKTTEVRLAVRKFLKPLLIDFCSVHDIALYDEKKEEVAAYETHLMALLGHLQMHPSMLQLKEPLTMNINGVLKSLMNTLMPYLEDHKKIVCCFMGEHRKATLVGGRLLPNSDEEQGRELHAQSFENLLKVHEDIVILDCGTLNSALKIDEKYANRVLVLPKEESPFDSICAAAHCMNENSKHFFCLGVDQGPANVFSRALNFEAQEHMAFIIPNIKAYDMRMEGEGNKYKQMISNCWVYKCPTPDQESVIIDLAYREMQNSN